MFTENNPFADDDDDDDESESTNQKPNSNYNNSQSISVKTPENYDDAMNPFADDITETGNSNKTTAPSVKQTNCNVKQENRQKKVLHFNPFEVSDSEEEVEEISSKKLTPAEQLKSAETPKKSPSFRHKKKQAPTPPAATKDTKISHPANDVTPTKPAVNTSVSTKPAPSNSTTTPVIDTRLSSQPNHNNQENLSESMNNSVKSEESNFNKLNSRDIKSPESVKKKSKPAPPRPMPPKRRVRIQSVVELLGCSNAASCVPKRRTRSTRSYLYAS